MSDNKIIYFTELRRLEHKFKGIEMGFFFLESLKKKIKFIKDNNNYNFFITLYDYSSKKKLNYFTTEKSFNFFFEQLYIEFLLCEVFYKTPFSKKLFHLIKKNNLNSKGFKIILGFEVKNQVKKLVLAIIFCLLQSRSPNKNIFCEDQFFDNLLTCIKFSYNRLSEHRIIYDIIKLLKENDFFFSLEEKKISLKDNSFYLLMTNFKLTSFIKIKNSNEISFIDNLDYLGFFQTLKVVVDEKININLLNYLAVFCDQETFNLLKTYYFDFKDCNTYKFNNIIDRNNIYYFNVMFNNKINLNIILFNIVISSIFDNYTLTIDN